MFKRLWCRLFGHVKDPEAKVYWRFEASPGGGRPASVGRTRCARCGQDFDIYRVEAELQLSDWQPMSTPPTLAGWYQVSNTNDPFAGIFWRRYADGRWYRPLEGSGEVIDAYEVAPPPGAQLLLSAGLTAYETIRWRGVL